MVPEGFDALIGLELQESSPELMRATVPVREKIKQPFGLVHGGLYATVAETLASLGTALAVLPDGKHAMGMSNNTTFLRPITSGTVHAEGRPRHRGRTTWVWDVDFLNDDGRLCASSRVTIAVREPA
ncbi:MAG: hotdog fold thioesterase [Solirubrobacteraceae bacterium]